MTALPDPGGATSTPASWLPVRASSSAACRGATVKVAVNEDLPGLRLESAVPHSLRVKEAKMPGTLKRVRHEMDVKPTPRDKGLTLTLRVTAYDNGMVEVDGVPINAAPAYDSGHGWLGAAETALLTLSEFRRQAEVRRKQKAQIPK
jgi:hypothetical protein